MPAAPFFLLGKLSYKNEMPGAIATHWPIVPHATVYTEGSWSRIPWNLWRILGWSKKWGPNSAPDCVGSRRLNGHIQVSVGHGGQKPASPPLPLVHALTLPGDKLSGRHLKPVVVHWWQGKLVAKHCYEISGWAHMQSCRSTWFYLPSSVPRWIFKMLSSYVYKSCRQSCYKPLGNLQHILDRSWFSGVTLQGGTAGSLECGQRTQQSRTFPNMYMRLWKLCLLPALAQQPGALHWAKAKGSSFFFSFLLE